jgi:UDP-GlcNAc:undecaprenyl-phosphate GlcNAc-1-phosphate transferase
VTAALLLLALSAVLALMLTPLVRTFARARGWLDQPDGRRKTHRAPVPRLGGVAVFGAFVGSGLVLAAGGLPGGDEALQAYVPLVLASAAVLLVGVWDDVRGVSPWAKLVVQTAAALYLFLHGYQVDRISNPFGGETVSLGHWALPLTLLWFVGMSNAFNLIDGLDGLAAGIGLFSTLTLFVAAAVNERVEVVLLSAALAGALLGFLRYNFAPASIFLGDSGALFVGFALAAFAIRGSMKSSAAIAVAAPLLALAVPILDATIAVARRFLSGQSVFAPDGDHIHHRLLRKGLTPARVVLTLYGAAALFGALSLLTMTERSQVIGIVVIAFSVVTWIGLQQLGYAEFGELQRVLRQGLLSHERQSIGNNVWLGSLGERFEQARDLDALRALLAETASRLGFDAVTLWREPCGDRRGSAPWLHWRAEPRALPPPLPATEPRVEWTLPLRAADETLATLVLAGPLGQPAFESARLLEALGSGLVSRLSRLAAAPTEEDPRREGHPLAPRG